LVDFPTRNDNILDLVLTNIPEKILNLEGFDDILETDHKILKFDLNLKIHPKIKSKRTVFNFKNANWIALKELLMHTPWDMAFVKNDINNSLSIWCDLFFAAVHEHIPKLQNGYVTNPPWIDTELLKLIRKKTHQRR
jgi:hypothetical protein